MFLLFSHPLANEVVDTIHKFYKLSNERKNMMRGNAFETWNEKYNANGNYSKMYQDVLAIRNQV